MDDYKNNSKLSEEEQSFLHSTETEDIGKLKMEAFHLRLRCYNLEERFNNCRCSTEGDGGSKDIYDYRNQLNQVVASHQELKWDNERLAKDNKLLRDKCDGISDDFEKKLSDYENIKFNFDKLKLIIENQSSVSSVVSTLMSENNYFVKENVEQKLKIRMLEKKLAEMNNSFIENESQRRKSLTMSLAKIIRTSNESFHNTSGLMSKSCFQCDELKVYTDKLSETVIKMTVDFQSLNKIMEQKNLRIVDLEQEILTLNSQPKIDSEQMTKYKKVAKQCMKKYLETKQSNEDLEKKYEQLIEFYMKQQGEMQQEIENLKKQGSNSNSKIIEETNKIGKMFVDKLSEVQEANDQISTIMKTFHVAEYDQVGQYSPQYKIRTDFLGNSSVVSDSDSVFYDRNVSLNNTMFKSRLDDSCVLEANVNEVVSNMQRKVRELGEVVQSYLTKIKVEYEGSECSKRDKSCLTVSENGSSSNTSAWSSSKIEHNESDVRDENHLKKMYEEEKQRNDSLLAEKVQHIELMNVEIETLKREKRDVNASHRTALEVLSSQHEASIAKYHQKTNQLRDEIQSMKIVDHESMDRIMKLETVNSKLENQLIECQKLSDCVIVKMKETHINLLKENEEAMNIISVFNENLSMKLNDMKLVFNKVKKIIEDNETMFPLDSVEVDGHCEDIKYIWRMLDLIDLCLRAKNVETVSANLSTPIWNVTQDVSDEDRLKESENVFYTSSLNLRGFDAVTRKSTSHLHDLTNVTDLEEEEHLPEIPKVDTATDKFKYIRDNPEKIHTKMKYYYDTCQTLKKAALQEHEENKRLKKNLSASVCEAIDEMTKKIDDFKRQLDMCKECLVRRQSSLPEAVAKELKELNLL